jgi:polysaccharide transporter, PST family
MTEIRKARLLRYGGFIFSVGGSQLIGFLITSVTFPFLVRRLGIEMYGLWCYVAELYVFVDIIANPALTYYATQYVAAHRKDGIGIVADFLAVRVLCSLPAIAVLLLIAALDVRQDVRHMLQLYGLGSLVVRLVSADYLLTALEMFHLRSVLTVIQQALYALGIFVFVHGSKDVFWVPISILNSVLFTGLASWLMLFRRGFRPALKVKPRRWKEILGTSLHYGLSWSLSNLYLRTGHIIVRWVLGEHALGLYAAGLRLLDFLRQFIVMVPNVLMPRLAFSARSDAELGRLARLLATTVALLSLPITFGLISTAHLLVPCILGPRYFEDVSFLRWMAPYLVIASLSYFVRTIIYATGRHRAYLASSAGGAVVGVILYLVLIPTFGLRGAGLAYTLGELVAAAMGYAMLPATLRDLWRPPVLVAALVGSVMMVMAVRYANVYSAQPFVVISIGSLAYFLSSGWFVRKWLVEQFAASE